MATNDINLKEGERAQRKLLVTVAEWKQDGESTPLREILGSYTEDSSIEFNADTETITDILGVTHSNINKTEPQQSFDPFYIQGGSALGAYLSKAALKNDINAYNGVFTLYIIALFMGEEDAYYAVKHKNCSIIPSSIGGSSYTSMPVDVYYSNDIEEGTIDKFSKNFVFTPTNGEAATSVSTFNLKQPSSSTTSSSAKNSTL